MAPTKKEPPEGRPEVEQGGVERGGPVSSKLDEADNARQGLMHG